jgi:hypothetical protein
MRFGILGPVHRKDNDNMSNDQKILGHAGEKLLHNYLIAGIGKM